MARLRAEREAGQRMRGQNANNAKKVQNLKRQIESMWNELENTYNLQGVTELENEIKAKKKELLSVHEETKAQVQVMRAQNKLLGEQEAYTEKRKD